MIGPQLYRYDSQVNFHFAKVTRRKNRHKFSSYFNKHPSEFAEIHIRIARIVCEHNIVLDKMHNIVDVLSVGYNNVGDKYSTVASFES